MTLPRRSFDVDGTLVDSQNHIVAAMDQAHDAVGLDRAAARGGAGRSSACRCPRRSGTCTRRWTRPAATRWSPATSAQRLRGTCAHRQRGAAVSRRRRAGWRGWRAARAAAGRRPPASRGAGCDAAFDAHDLHGHFVTPQTADDHPSKPHPAMLLAALAETGVEAARAVMIGDTEYDIAMGRAAGVRTIGVAWGYHRARPADGGRGGPPGGGFRGAGRPAGGVVGMSADAERRSGHERMAGRRGGSGPRRRACRSTAVTP